MELTKELLYGFVGSVLSGRFDEPAATPDCHLEWWDLCCSKHPYVAIAAPRGHAKSTAITKSYTLAAVLFRDRKFVIIVSDTYKQAVLFLGEIKKELYDNEDLRELFDISEFLTDREDDIIVKFKDGKMFRIIAVGSEQKIRGTLWNGARPDLIICDDIENDELVLNQDRREKFRNWFFGALLPARSQRGVVRMVGTILHMDSLLERLMPRETDKYAVKEQLRIWSKNPNSTWKTFRYSAHNADFSQILWPQKWSEQRLKAERQTFIDQGNPEGYYQEYLNRPLDPSNAYFKKDDFIPMEAYDYDIPPEQLNFYIGCDLATTLKQRSDYSAFVVGAVDQAGMLYIRHVIRERMEANEIIETLFRLQERYKPVMICFEAGQIKTTLMPFLNAEMFRRNVFLNVDTPAVNSLDKRQRARSMQARMRAGGVKFDRRREWYADFEQELLRFDRDVHDDQVDAFAWLGITIDKQIPGKTAKEVELDEYEEEANLFSYNDLGRSLVTGY